MSACMPEHRWGDRVPVDIAVQLIGSSRAFGKGRLKDLSISGALVETDFTAPVLANVTLMILDTQRSPRRPRAIHAYVVRQCDGTIGIGWWDLAPPTIKRLLAISKAMTPRADLLLPSTEAFPQLISRGMPAKA